MTRIPVPLNALRAFEAAARHLSIKAAAEELAVTPSAVSHQLRILEDCLGLELLRRSGPRIALTETGRSIAPELSAGFGRIAQAVGGLRQERRHGPLRLSLLPTFAVHWLSPRLASYPFERQGFDLLIGTTQEAVDLAGGAADVAIRHGTGAWPGLEAELLFEESVGLLAPPALLRGGKARLRQAVAQHTLFLSQHRRSDFAAWNAGRPGGPLTPAATVTVDSAGLGLRAAIDGAGFTLAGLQMAAADIAAGRLALACRHRLPVGKGYYLVYPPALRGDRRLRNLRKWLFAQIEPDTTA